MVYALSGLLTILVPTQFGDIRNTLTVVDTFGLFKKLVTPGKSVNLRNFSLI